ncbi:nuclear transport factor 2 family protein [Amycolatopsis minnesotensis]|uniref:Nuclear transport factor 2 family protein n=1 Tax=Amycolatopsis minnesotensis TaxID=337894 RepID=A0ABN2QJK2_9PSEU
MTTQTGERPARFASAELYAEVQQFYARHLRLLDSGAIDDWARTFTEDGTFEVPTVPAANGRAAIAASMHRAAAALAESGEVRRHWHGMVDVEPFGDGTWRVSCYAMVFATPRGGPSALFRVCVCEDVLVRVRGELLVRARRVTRDDLAP